MRAVKRNFILYDCVDDSPLGRHHRQRVAAASQTPALNKERVAFKSGGLTLTGFLFKPDGPGPFPAIVWNHGSEKNPGGGPQFNGVARVFVPHGCVVFAPFPGTSVRR